MAGNKEQGKKAAQTNIERYGSNFYANIGSFGGSMTNPNKGFGSDRERARLAGSKGGKVSKRGKNKVDA